MLFSKQIETIYRSSLFSRQDPSPAVFYFSPSYFPGLHQTPYPFPAHLGRTRAGHTLAGWIYEYENPISDRLVIFDHGMGAGHRAYLREIEMLARHGYRVLAYDHTGCADSGGENTNGFAQSLSDLDACLCAIEADPSLRDLSISVIGHSWGGFATMNIGALHPHITHLVALSGFVSVERMLRQQFSGILHLYFSDIYRLEQAANPDYVGYSADQSLKQTNAKVLLIHSPDDKLVSFALHFEYLQKQLVGRENITFLPVLGHGHNPNYTTDAVAYKDTFFTEMTKQLKKKALGTEQAQNAFRKSWDWERMTAQDEAVWDAIFAHLAS